MEIPKSVYCGMCIVVKFLHSIPLFLVEVVAPPYFEHPPLGCFLHLPLKNFFLSNNIYNNKKGDFVDEQYEYVKWK